MSFLFLRFAPAPRALITNPLFFPLRRLIGWGEINSGSRMVEERSGSGVFVAPKGSAE